MAAYVAGPWIPASAGMTVGGGCHTLKDMVGEPGAAYFHGNIEDWVEETIKFRDNCQVILSNNNEREAALR